MGQYVIRIVIFLPTILTDIVEIDYNSD